MKKDNEETSLHQGEQGFFCPFTTVNSEYTLREVIKLNQCPQRQDALEAQLKDIIVVAEKLGCYYASHFIKNLLKL